MHKLRKRILTAMVVVASIYVGSARSDFASAAEKAYPSREVNLCVGIAPGGNVDTATRAMGKILSEMWGRQVVIINKPGAAQAASFAYVSHAKPDGYTLAYATNPYLVLKKMEEPTLPYEPEKITWLGVTAVSRNVLIVKGDAPWKTFEAFVDFGKKNPNKIIFGSDGSGGSQHLAELKLADMAGIKSFVHVPFGGSAPKIQALLGGHVNATIQSVGGTEAFVKSGDLRYLLIFDDERDPEYPELPTAKEKGLNLVTGSWAVFAGPMGLPSPIVEKLVTDIKKAAGNEQLLALYKKMGYRYAYFPPEECVKLWKEDENAYGPYMKKYGFIK